MNFSSIRENLIQSIGNTPLIRLWRASEETGCTILGKAEFMNPGGSVKDRAAKAIVLDAEKQGVLKPGGLLVAGTAGTTGVGFVENVAKKYFQYEVIWITIFIMGMLGLIFDITIRKIIDKTIPWRGKG